MKFFSFFIVIVSVASFASVATAAAAPYVCNGTFNIDPPANFDKPYFYPNTWSDNQVLPQYQMSQFCQWNINVPAGYSAKLVMQGTAQSDSYFQVQDSAQHYDMTGVATSKVAYYYTTKFTIYLNAGTNYGPGTFAFKIVWSKLPSTTPTFSPVASGSAPFVKSTADISQGGVVVFGETQVSIISVPAEAQAMDALREVLVFDGPDMTKYIGSLYHIYQANKQFVSTGTRAFLINLNSKPTAGQYFIAQDYSNTKQFVQYTGVACGKADCPVVLDGGRGPAGAITVFDGDETLQKGSLDDDTTLKVYSGGAKDHNLLAQYTDKNIDQSLPQKFGGVIRQYTIDTGFAVLYLSR